MSKAKENTAPVEQTDAEVAAEAAAVKTVTIPETELEALRADIRLLKQQLVSEDRLAAKKSARQAEEERLLQIVEEENARAEELVDVHVELGSIRGNKNIEVAVNGRQYVIPRGETVQVPRKVKEIIDNALRQRDEAYGLQKRRRDESEKNIKEYGG